MPIFKYTVVNKEGKKLSGSVESTDEVLAREELNNLGFSILELSLAKEEALSDTKDEASIKNKFVFEAKNPQGQNVTGTIPGKDEFESYKRLVQEYELTVSALWKINSTEEDIQNARIRGTRKYQDILDEQTKASIQNEEIKSAEREKKELLVHTEVENVLKRVADILTEYETLIDADQRREIDKQVEKVLRIKNSNNLEYIISSTEELLKFIEKQEETLKKKGYLDKRTKLKIRVKEMLQTLHATTKPKSLSEDIVGRIQLWQQKNVKKATKSPWFITKINNILESIKDVFTTPEIIKVLKDQIRSCNSQLFEYAKMYFKEPTPEYKAKVRGALSIIWAKRAKTIRTLKETRRRLKEEKKKDKKVEIQKGGKTFFETLETDLSEFTGWLLAFYLIYYFVTLYITTKNFGLGDVSEFPKSLRFYDTQIFKYALAVVFLIHVALSLKVNFFEKNKIASAFIFPIMLISIIFTLVNF